MGGGAHAANSECPFLEQPSFPPQLMNSMTLSQTSFGRRRRSSTSRTGGSSRSAWDRVAGSWVVQTGVSSKGCTALYVQPFAGGPSVGGPCIAGRRLDRM